MKIIDYSFLMRQTWPKAMVLQIITLNWYLVSIKFNSVPNNELLKFKIVIQMLFKKVVKYFQEITFG